MVLYRHTQIGNVILGTCLVMVAGMCLIGSVAGMLRWMLPAMVALALAAILFGSLTTEIADGELRCRFGIGLIRKRIPLRHVVAVEPVRNRWFWGWGIRYTPHGWLFNVSGLDAVELSLVGGRRLRIGTDEPDELARAIRGAIEAS